MQFKVGDVVYVEGGPARYNNRRGIIKTTRTTGKRVQFGVEFLGRRATPLFVGRSKLRLA